MRGPLTGHVCVCVCLPRRLVTMSVVLGQQMSENTDESGTPSFGPPFSTVSVLIRSALSIEFDTLEWVRDRSLPTTTSTTLPLNLATDVKYPLPSIHPAL